MRKEGIGVSPAGPCPWRTCTRGVFPVWSLSTTLLTKACIDYLGPLSPSDACGQRGCSSTTPAFLHPMYQLHARSLTYPSYGLSKYTAMPSFAQAFFNDKPWFPLPCKCSYLSTLNKKQNKTNCSLFKPFLSST